jgi:hypothetical protein
MISDREGQFEVSADEWALVENYRFGTRTCDFLICKRCGVFIAAVAESTAGAEAVVNVNCLNDRERFTSVPTLHHFEGETVETRLSRRAANWMPAIIRRIKNLAARYPSRPPRRSPFLVSADARGR